MTDSQFVTAPTSEYAEVVLAAIPRHSEDPAEDLLAALSDPAQYSHVFACREGEGDSDE